MRLSELRDALQAPEWSSPEVLVLHYLPPRRSIEDHLLATSRPRPVDPDEDLRQRRRLAREDAQRRFDTVGLPRARRLSEVRP